MEAEAKSGTSGTGTIARMFPRYAFIRPDQKQYGSNVFMSCVAAGVDDLHKQFQIGDRVEFTYVKSLARCGCPWVATGITRPETEKPKSDGTPASGVLKPRSQKEDLAICNGEGTIKVVRSGHGWITVQKPFKGEAFFSGAQLLERASEALATAFPVGTSATFMLEARFFNNEYGWYATSVSRKPTTPAPQPEKGDVKSGSLSKKTGPGAEIEKASDTGCASGKPIRSVWQPKVQLDTTKSQTDSRPVMLLVQDDFAKVKSCEKDEPLDPPALEKAPNMAPAFLDRQRLRPVTSAPHSLASRSTQTDPLVEISLLSRLFNDKEVFDFIFPRYPELVHKWITRSIGLANLGN